MNVKRHMPGKLRRIAHNTRRGNSLQYSSLTMTVEPKLPLRSPLPHPSSSSWPVPEWFKGLTTCFPLVVHEPEDDLPWRIERKRGLEASYSLWVSQVSFEYWITFSNPTRSTQRIRRITSIAIHGPRHHPPPFVLSFSSYSANLPSP